MEPLPGEILIHQHGGKREIEIESTAIPLACPQHTSYHALSHAPQLVQTAPTQVEPFLVSFSYSSTEESVQIEIEVLKMWLLSIYGVRVRRTAGSTWLFKQLYSSLVKAIRIE